MFKRFDLTRGRHTGCTERGRDWAGGQFLSLRGDSCEVCVRNRKILAFYRKGKICQCCKMYNAREPFGIYFSLEIKLKIITILLFMTDKTAGIVTVLILSLCFLPSENIFPLNSFSIYLIVSAFLVPAR